MRHYLSPEKQAQIVAMLTPAGMPVRRIAEAIGCNATNARTTIVNLATEGRVFTVRTSTAEAPRSEVWAFPTAEDRDAFAAERRQAIRDRVLAYRRNQAAKRKEARHAEGRVRGVRSEAALKREAERRALRAAEAEIAKQRARLEREAAAADRQRNAAEAKSLRERLKIATREAGRLAKLRGTASPAASPARGPAHLPGDLDLSKARTVIAERPRDRFAPDEGYCGVFSQLKPGQYLEAA